MRIGSTVPLFMKFKVLLALDSVPGNLWDLDLVHPDIQIEF